MYISMFNNSKGLKKSKMKNYTEIGNFSVDFFHGWLRISETTDHTKMLESQHYVF